MDAAALGLAHWENSSAEPVLALGILHALGLKNLRSGRRLRSASSEADAGGVRQRVALLPPDATGNFTKIVQRIPVKIVLDDGALAGLLHPGMSVEPTIDNKATALAQGGRRVGARSPMQGLRTYARS